MFGKIALECTQVPAQENALQRRDCIGGAFAGRGRQIGRKAAPAVFGFREGRTASHAGIVPALALHGFPAAQFETQGFRGAVLRQPGLQIVLGFKVKMRAGRLAGLLA